MHYTIFAGAYFTISFPREYVLAREPEEDERYVQKREQAQSRPGAPSLRIIMQRVPGLLINSINRIL